MITLKSIQRFFEKVEQTTNCWEWVAYKNRKGYGVIKHNGKTVLAHRFSYELIKGDIPEGLQLDHLCKNRACVNPTHLEVVTNQENCLRGLVNQNKNKTHCIRGHEFTPKNTGLTKERWRYCKICNKLKLRIKEKIVLA